MRETYYAGAYWPGRVEPLEAYARRADAFFRLLAPLDPALASWFEQADSREAALTRKVAANWESLLSFLKSKNSQAGGGPVSFAAWNGEATGSSVVGFSCGSRSPRIADLCTLTPPAEGPIAERILSAPVLTQVLRSMALAWEPEFGIVTSHIHRDEVLKLHKAGTFVGWVMYFSHHRGRVPALPAPVRVVAVEGQGTLVVLTPERFSASNPEHVALAAHVQELLGQAGLLKPVQPSPPAAM